MDRRRSLQEDVEDPILRALENGAILTTQEIYCVVRSQINPYPADLERAARRGNETKIDQIIANALQAKRRLSRDGFIERLHEGEFRITPAGLRYLEDCRTQVEQMAASLADIYPGLFFDDD